MNKLLKILSKNNSTEFNIRKTIEELNELNLELIHFLNKNINNKKNIMQELVDVEIRLEWLKKYLNCDDKYKSRRNKKIKKLLKNVTNKRYSS